MELYEIVMKLIGPVQPTGDHNADQTRLQNLKLLTELTDKLLFDIDDAAQNADRLEASMKAIGVHARDFLAEVQENIDLADDSPNINLTYAQAKNAIKLFNSEWIGQEPKQLWEWAVSQTGKN